MAAFICVLIGSQSGGSSANPAPTLTYAVDTPTPDPSETSAPTKPSKTPMAPPASANYWADGLAVEDVTDTLANDKICSFDMCVFIKMTALKNCSSITLDGDIYDVNDEYFDSFSLDYKGMKKGQSRIVELGDDAIDDTEDYVELADSTCFK